MSSDAISTLLAKTKSPDNDVKTDAISKLQLEFESGTEIPDVDAVTTTLKTCLRISNQHLAIATVAAIQAFIPRIAGSGVSNTRDALASSVSSASDRTLNHDLRQAITAFLPSGGVIDRLNETRESTRALSRNTLVDIGLAAIRLGGTATSSGVRKGDKSETLYGLYEKYLKEVGFTHKVWRVREQTLLAVVQLRQRNPSFPLRSYLPLLVDALEDSDSNVRDCARQSTIALFSAAGVSDAARTDLKNEMAKKNVRKTIVEPILAAVMSSATSAASSQGDPSDGDRATPGPSRTITRKASRELPRALTASTRAALGPETLSGDNAPPAPSSTDAPVVYIASARDLEQEFARMAPHFEGKESEQNWSLREQDIIRIRGMVKGEAHIRYPDAFVQGLRSGIIELSFKALLSLRTTLSIHASTLYAELAEALGPALDPLVDSLLTHLIRMAGFTKKLVASNTQASVTAIIIHTACQPRILLQHLSQTVLDKAESARVHVVGHVSTFLRVHGLQYQTVLESHGGLDQLDKIIRKGLTDNTPTVRAKAREAYWLFQPIWPAVAAQIAASLPPASLKQLEAANPAGVPASAAAASGPKKASVAAMIKASRVKAKAIKEDPPSLRHAATSGAAAHRTSASPTASIRRVSESKPPLMSSTSQQRRSASPSGPPSPGISTNSTSRVTTSRTVSASSTLRSPPSSRMTGATSPSNSPPPSPTADLSSRRKTMSPLMFMDPKTPVAHQRSASQVLKPITPPDFTKGHARPNSASRHSISSLRRLQENDQAAFPRESLDLNGANGDDSLLMAVQNPLPDDSDEDDDAALIEATMRLPTLRGRVTPITTPATVQRPAVTRAGEAPSPPNPQSPQSSIRTLFPGDSISQTATTTNKKLAPHSPTQDVIEDAIRANAEQAESSAERLTELMEPDQPYHSTATLVPPSLARGGPPIKALGTPARPTTHPPTTPANPQKGKGLLSQLALFQNSPAVKSSPSVMDRLYENKATSGWWLKRKTLLDAGTPVKPSQQSQQEELLLHIKALQDGTASVRTLQKLVIICNANPALSPDETPDTPPPGVNGHSVDSDTDIWGRGKAFDNLMNALLAFLRSTWDEELLEYGLCVIWEMVEHQTVFLDESEIFSLLFQVRYINTHPILEATSTIRDNLVGRQEPVWCLKTLHGCLLQYLAQTGAPEGRTITDARVLAQIRAGTQAFGIIGLGKLIMRLPPEVLEDELPLLKKTLTSVLDERDPARTTVREAAYATIVAAQSVLRDETHLFELLDGLEVSKKNLLTYYFDKHGARGAVEGVKASAPPATPGQEVAEDEKVVKELIRLDVKISTPVKSP